MAISVTLNHHTVPFDVVNIFIGTKFEFKIITEIYPGRIFGSFNGAIGDEP